MQARAPTMGNLDWNVQQLEAANWNSFQQTPILAGFGSKRNGRIMGIYRTLLRFAALLLEALR